MLKLIIIENLEYNSDLEGIVKLSAENFLFSRTERIELEYLSKNYKQDIFIAVDYLASGSPRTVGFSNGSIIKNSLGNNNFKLTSLYVTPEYSHIGIGKELLHNVNIRALNSNCREVVCNKNNNFLKQNGFELDFQTNQLRKSVYSNLIEHKIH
jgi:GNAT superfamily N-acetyltransferase